MTPNIYFLARVWREFGRTEVELHEWKLFEPELTLNLKKGFRPIEDWWEESFMENVCYNPESFTPDGLELYDEPIWLEVIGSYSAQGWQDYYGEYDEDFEFNIIDWTVEVEEDK